MNDSDRERKREILELKRRRKHELDKRIATYGLSSDPGVIIERDDLEEDIKKLERELALISPSLTGGVTRVPVIVALLIVVLIVVLLNVYRLTSWSQQSPHDPQSPMSAGPLATTAQAQTQMQLMVQTQAVQTQSVNVQSTVQAQTVAVQVQLMEQTRAAQTQMALQVEGTEQVQVVQTQTSLVPLTPQEGRISYQISVVDISAIDFARVCSGGNIIVDLPDNFLLHIELIGSKNNDYYGDLSSGCVILRYELLASVQVRVSDNDNDVYALSPEFVVGPGLYHRITVTPK